MNGDICRACGCDTQWNDTGITANGGFHLAECRVCHSVLVVEQVSKVELDAAYKQLFKKGNYGGLTTQLERVRSGKSIFNPIWLALAFLLERLSPGRRMAEIGGGVGLWGHFAVGRKWSYTNFDVSPEAVEVTHSIGLRSEVFEIGTLPPLGVASYDAIVMLDVIEHVWNVSEYLKLCYRAFELAPK